MLWRKHIHAASVLLVTVAGTRAVDYTWDGDVNGSWGNAQNWTANSGFPDGAADTATFTGTVNTEVSLGGKSRTIGGLTFNSAATAFSLDGGVLNLVDGGSIVKRAAATAHHSHVRVPVNLPGAVTFRNESSGDWNQRLYFWNSISGSNVLHIQGPGAVEFKGDSASTFTGTFQVDGGVIVIGHGGALGNAGQGTIVSGGSLQFEGGVTTPEAFTFRGNASQSSFSSCGISGDIQIDDGVIWTISNGGGNGFQLTGAVTGAGTVVMTSGGTTLGGSGNNTLSGLIDHRSNRGSDGFNTLHLSKVGGATAIAGPLNVSHKAIVRWNGSDQVADSVPVTLAGGVLKPNGHSDSLGTLTLAGKAVIDLSGGPNTLRFADSSALDWGTGNQLILRNWDGSATDTVTFGNGPSALTTGQLAQIGFSDPAGRDPGVYLAKAVAAGEIVPTDTAVVPVDPPFDVSADAQTAREAVYTSQGRADLTGTDTPLRAGASISLFGDSITWLNVYLSRIQSALDNGAGTAGLGVKLHNRGINGGGVLQVRDGSTSGTFDGNPQAGFANVIDADGADAAVVFIGINDVWWRGTSAAAFESALGEIADAAAAAGVHLVLATLTVHNELPDGTNADDPKIEQFAQITRDVAAAKDTTLVDLRRVYVAYLQNNNWELNLDGSLTFQSTGILTYDGVHPNTQGNDLLADHIAQGIAIAFGATPDPELPAVPELPSPSNGAVNVQISTTLNWADSTHAGGYDVRLWLSSASKPQAPTATVAGSKYDPPGGLIRSTNYSWQVVATNALGASTGAVWRFTTGSGEETTYIWDGGGADNRWDNPNNWAGDNGFPGSGDTATLQGSARTTVDLNGSQSVKHLEFADANAFTVQNGTLKLASGGTITKRAAGTVNQTVTADLQLGGAATFRNDNNWVHEAHKLILSGSISGEEQITIEGTGSGGVQLGGNNTAFTGSIVVDSGALIPRHAGALGDTATKLSQNGGLIWWNANANNIAEDVVVAADASWSHLNWMTLKGDVEIKAGATLTSSQGGGNSFVLDNAVTGAGDINFTAGNVEFRGTRDNTLLGTITIDKGNTSLNDMRLNKTGATAIAGDLEVTRFARVRWLQSDQIADRSAVTASDDARLEILARTETIGALTLSSRALVDTTGGGVMTVVALTAGGVPRLPGRYTSAESFVFGEGWIEVPDLYPGTVVVVR